MSPLNGDVLPRHERTPTTIAISTFKGRGGRLDGVMRAQYQDMLTTGYPSIVQ
jgi:hypothetical protein